MTQRSHVPSGYTWLRVGNADLVTRLPLVPVFQEALRDGTLHDFAARYSDRPSLSGRGPVYVVQLPGTEIHAVVRRSRHGGMLAPLRGDVFFGDTRAPRELAVSIRLRRLGIPTPEIIAYATYGAAPLARRADVVSIEIPDARDLASILTGSPVPTLTQKRTLLDATALLLDSLTAAGARHPDLNLKNILIAPDDDGLPQAVVLDVDRVWFDTPGNARVTEANLRRLMRSARKWQRLHSADITEEDLARLAERVRGLGAGAIRDGGAR
ncbi:MAG TPA: lipopolysaccharide kinase InaA family protein [Gemmatimonadaceae bacterium]|nr:lipopolysaccharide kinase InaA family protein [Gemmatimonadaceae bacterium]